MLNIYMPWQLLGTTYMLSERNLLKLLQNQFLFLKNTVKLGFEKCVL